MSEPEKPVLGDKSIYPSDEFLLSIIGDKMVFWQKLVSYVKDNYTDITEEWRYYNDGRQWLFKMQRKKKTIFWASILKDTFRITFYFGNKAEPVIGESPLPQKIKDGFRDARRFGALRPISIVVDENQDFDNILKLIDVKIKLN